MIRFKQKEKLIPKYSKILLYYSQKGLTVKIEQTIDCRVIGFQLDFS